jgi:tetratricopeptide (TPR) repeat protein
MTSHFSKPVGMMLVFAALLLVIPKSVAQSERVEAEKDKQDETKDSPKSTKTHFAKGNQAMQDAQAIRQRLQGATNNQTPALLDKMKANYLVAITEYQQALQDTRVKDENGVRVLGKIGVIRNGLVSQEKAVDMLVQDKDLPVILSNLGLAYSGAEEYEDAIAMLQQATILKPAAGTYIELSADLAKVGKTPEAMLTCDKIPNAEPTAKDMQARCYKNIAIVLMDEGKLADAIRPLEKATQLNPQDPLAWKLLGDSLTSTITTKSQNGKTIYLVPPGAVDAYQKCLQLQPKGPYAEQVKSALDALAQMNSVSASEGTKEKN